MSMPGTFSYSEVIEILLIEERSHDQKKLVELDMTIFPILIQICRRRLNLMLA